MCQWQPPKLAYQREQFFANLLKKAHKGKGKGKRRSTVGRLHAQHHNMNSDEMPNAGVGRLSEQSARIKGGFVGTKMTRGIPRDAARPGTSPGLMSYPLQRLSTPDVSQRRRGRTAITAGVQRASTICMTPAEAEPVAEPEQETNTQWLEMRTMTECHNRDLTSMKSEIETLRDDLASLHQLQRRQREAEKAETGALAS